MFKLSLDCEQTLAFLDSRERARNNRAKNPKPGANERRGAGVEAEKSPSRFFFSSLQSHRSVDSSYFRLSHALSTIQKGTAS